MKRLLLPTLVFAALWCVALATEGHGPVRAGVPSEPITFSNQIVRIFQQNCQSCHHPGDIGPFSLMGYEEAALWAPAIREKVITREMPPWKPAEGCGEFLDARALSQDEIDTIVAWVDSGAPEGDPANLPEELVFSDEWDLGEPDAVLVTSKRPFKFAATNTEDVYRCFTVPPDFDADRFISAVEVLPGNREIVHHVLLFVDTTGESIALDLADPGPGYASTGGGIGFTPTAALGGWAPGASPYIMPTNAGVLVPKGARVVIQVHYSVHHLHGEDQFDQTKVGLYFARSPIYKDFITLPLLNNRFTIPAGAASYPVTASITLPPLIDLTLHQIAPHMHLLGQQMRVTATLPSGETRCLVDIPNWDFHWQGSYRYVEPIQLPGRTQIEMTAIYDNSTNNPDNPSSPPRDVSWGEGTKDEMCLVFLGITVDAERRSVSSPAIEQVRIAGSKLVVSGTDIGKGSLIEVDGVVLRDTKVKRKGAVSRADWQSAIAPGRSVQITVLNPDGARSAPVPFGRS